MKNNLAFYLIPVIFFVVGSGMLIAGYYAAPGSLTDDGYPLNDFFYAMGGFFILFPLLLTLCIRFFYRRNAGKVNYLITQGIKGKARVLGIERTGTSINDIPQVILKLKITTDLGEQFLVDYKKCIDPIYYSLITPERDLPVFVHPENKKEVHLDLEAAWTELSEG